MTDWNYLEVLWHFSYWTLWVARPNRRKFSECRCPIAEAQCFRVGYKVHTSFRYYSLLPFLPWTLPSHSFVVSPFPHHEAWVRRLEYGSVLPITGSVCCWVHSCLWGWETEPGALLGRGLLPQSSLISLSASCHHARNRFCHATLVLDQSTMD